MSTSDLTTLAQVREHQQKTDATNTVQDGLINDLITVASVAIMRYTQREFAPQVTSTTRTYRYNGRGVLSLAPDDARTITAVSIDTDTDSPTVLETTQYKLWPTRNRDGVYTHIHLTGVTNTPTTTEEYPTYRQVSVTGTWGWPSIPEPVERACILLVMDLISRTSSWRNSGMDDMLPTAGGAAIPLHVRTMLSPYRRHTAGGV